MEIFMATTFEKLPSRFASFSIEEFEKSKLAIEKEAIARLTRGNIPAQWGHYTTRAELEAMRDQIERDLVREGKINP